MLVRGGAVGHEGSGDGGQSGAAVHQGVEVEGARRGRLDGHSLDLRGSTVLRLAVGQGQVHAQGSLEGQRVGPLLGHLVQGIQRGTVHAGATVSSSIGGHRKGTTKSSGRRARYRRLQRSRRGTGGRHQRGHVRHRGHGRQREPLAGRRTILVQTRSRVQAPIQWLILDVQQQVVQVRRRLEIQWGVAPPGGV